MTSRRANDGGSVLSFTFLDVLMCTMGSLLLLLVVFGVIAKKSTRARRAGEDARISLSALKAPDSAPTAPALPAEAEGPTDATDPVELARELERIRAEQEKLELLRGEAAERRREEAARISHLEDHERRLEHELGKLHVALQTLKAAEEKQTVDQGQAEAEAQRLKEILREMEERLAEMRKNADRKSYAIVPYKGANGTFRRPLFVECTDSAVIIQPEGIRLTPIDFDGPLRSGNPLAAAVRAAHEELDARATASGATEMPNAYPLFVVRPGGNPAYVQATDAVSSWSSDYGYEFVEADWKLRYPEPDPRLAQVMAHAVDEARQRQALLARVAPREYGSRLDPSGLRLVAGEGDGGGGGGFQALAGGPGNRIGAHAGKAALRTPAGNSLGGGNFSDEFEGQGAGGEGADQSGGWGAGGSGGGSGPGGPGAGEGPGQLAGAAGGGRDTRAGGHPSQGQSDSAAGSNGAGTEDGGSDKQGDATFASTAGTQQGPAGEPGSAAGGSGSTSGGGSSSASGGAGGSEASGSAGGAAGATASSSMGGGMAGLPPVQVGQRRRGSAAETRGQNWANAAASRNAAAITRPIKLQVNRDQLIVLDTDGRPVDAAAVTFQQPIDGVMDQLSAAVQRQVSDWGLAGDGMYWRPTLVVSVAPGAERQAERLAELLDNSGIDVRLPQATARAAGGSSHGAR